MPASEPVPFRGFVAWGPGTGCDEAGLLSLSVLCRGALSPAESHHAGQPLDSKVPLEEEHLCQLLIMLMR